VLKRVLLFWSSSMQQSWPVQSALSLHAMVAPAGHGFPLVGAHDSTLLAPRQQTCAPVVQSGAPLAQRMPVLLAQTPAEQTKFAPHAWLQLPQFAGSLMRFAPAHADWESPASEESAAGPSVTGASAAGASALGSSASGASDVATSMPGASKGSLASRPPSSLAGGAASLPASGGRGGSRHVSVSVQVVDAHAVGSPAIANPTALKTRSCIQRATTRGATLPASQIMP
jgi:hypothetical protein